MPTIDSTTPSTSSEPLAINSGIDEAALRNPPMASCRPILFVVEGIHDIHYLRRISRMLHADNAELPDLAVWEAAGRLVFVPFGGGDVFDWTDRLAPVGLPELHLYDAEAGIDTSYRQRAAARVNSRPGCRAFVTSKRNLENYLAPDAIFETRGITIEFGDEDNVADLAARSCFEQAGETTVWELLPGRTRKRFRERAKHWLNTSAVERMTPERQSARDTDGEVARWLRTAAELAECTLKECV